MIHSRFSRVVFAMICAVLAAACSDSPASPAANAPFSQTDLRVGAGIAAAPGNVLVVEYTGWLYDPTKPDQKGLQFDTSADVGPFEFTLGTGLVIQGWHQGLVGMKVGGLRRLVIPPSLGYGAVRQGPIPPNSSMVFDIELIDVKEATQ